MSPDFVKQHRNSNKKIKKLIRQVVFDDIDTPYKAINKFRKSESAKQIFYFEELLRISTKSQLLPAPFPEEPQINNRNIPLETLPIPKQLSILDFKIQKHYAELHELIRLIQKLNKLIINKDLLEAQELILQIINEFGYCHLLLRKMALVIELSKQLNIEVNELEDLLECYNNNGENKVISSLQQCF